MDCIFCKIIRGEEPASMVYEDEMVLGFMTPHQFHEGMCLVTSKQHIDHFMDLPEDVAVRIIQTAQKIAKNIMREFQPQRVGYVVAGFGVLHAHLNIVSMKCRHDITSKHFAYMGDNGEFQFSESHLPTAARAELDQLAARIKV
ncbi:hypothetical protein A3H65_00230 [Candidatus Giovannonibacteria bacterium RIFCSPLOWO2_02_FULL_45_14]|uniref:Hit, histidine triad domain-containing protein n=2 Tax=Parcubacteria group TaxID=1794811 RepID=A0A0H4T752_9BACT|nr:hit, histidine triad domain-containing protein [uncultured Parcubacteria bacterium Rifle_16ft_4_minimus_37658]OGF68974.1 MAG: hypothetical protein A3C75_02200 [Candidatus Giovannonibacteria bacterium RIFCSPHIGHO2_02_FULL_44_31]OGF76246.1 MAG: hypothetical protein A3E62_03895 [Candidatus Giovannonibacteria bacterium RIFCSPHIGHO2_12_FULL_44_29]OGF91142.1 MAG: hypothetical protein A3H65_00230 [Candidatus Giovannonibacteria bacterium RIFCSPLOWO2_02_FULL_45_14]OGF93603.1 MAG: hypothetical protein